MKQVLLILTCLFSIKFSSSQTVIEVKKESGRSGILSKAEVSPSFPGGEDAFRKFVRDNIQTDNIKPDSSATEGDYTVIVKFIVSIDGNIADLYCVNDPGYGLCQEAIRVIKKSGKWTPGLQNGRKVNAYHLQSIRITIGE